MLERQLGRFWKAGIVLAAMPVFACTSSRELETIQSRLEEIRFEVLQLQKLGPTKAEVAEMGSALGQKIEELVSKEVASEATLRELAERIGELEAKLEDTDFRLAQLSQQIAATNQELQAVRNAAEVVRTPLPPPPTPANPADPQALYDTAYNDYGRGNYDLAILGFRQYLDAAPETDLADNAAYWIGECYFRQQSYQQAITQFDEVLTRWAASDRNPSALLRKGYAYFELGQRAQGVVQLQNVICEYGGTDEAHLASQRLQELGIDVECAEP